MTEQEKQMMEVIKAMPEVFETENEGTRWRFSRMKSSEGFGSSRWNSVDGSTRYALFLSPAQHTAWVCECLMKWLRRKGYQFRCYYDGQWGFRLGNVGEEINNCVYPEEWPALYAAWQHWEVGQQPKEETRWDKLVEFFGETVHAATVTKTPEQWADAIMAVLRKEKTNG